jgi:putative nucleotidyltransferase with HDIG domain
MLLDGSPDGAILSDPPLRLMEEADATDLLLGQAARGERISLSVARAVVQSLSVAMHHERSVLGLLVPLTEADQYTAIHSMNAAMLAMGLAEALGFLRADVVAIGEAAILHDVGKARVPAEIIRKPGELSPEEWTVLQRHPAEGARMLLNSGPEMDLAATVAYEHHIRYDGSGYPGVRYRRKLHRVTQLFQVCDVYDALRTRRPFRGPWPVAKVVPHLLVESGKTLYPAAVEAFTGMLRAWEAVGGDFAQG